MAFREPRRRDWIETIVYVVAAALAISFAGLYLGQRQIVVPLAVMGGILALLVRWHTAVTGYRCGRCGHEFAISAWRDFLSPHMLSTKYLKCPACGERTWAKVLRREG